MRVLIRAVFALALLASLSAQANQIAIPADRAEEATRLVAAMLVAGRGVVAASQKNINDPEKGDKGFTPDFVEKAMVQSFESATGKSLDSVTDPDVKAALMATLQAARKAVASNQARINEQGKGFKGFIPAVFGRLTGNVLKGETGIEIKQTTFTPRNEYNKPDDYELKVLKQFEQSKPKNGVGEKVGSRYRYLQPVYIQEACLQCHGDPKGELDIAGKKKEGYKVGDLRGAISVSVALR